MIGKDFLYNERLASSFGLVMADPESTQSFPTLDMDYTSLTSVRSYTNIFNVRYSGVLTLNLRLVRDPCDYEEPSEARLTAYELNEIRSWLESPMESSVLRMYSYYDDDLNDVVCYNGLFTSVQPFGWGEECYGLDVTFSCMEPYGYIESGATFTVSPPTSLTATYFNMSCDKNRFLYPLLEIVSKDNTVFTGSEEVTIKNANDNNLAMTVNLPAGCTELVLDCKRKIAYGILEGEKKSLNLSDIWVLTETTEQNADISAQSFLFYWLRLASDQNTLTFSFGSNTKNVKEVRMQCDTPYKSGGY